MKYRTDHQNDGEIADMSTQPQTPVTPSNLIEPLVTDGAVGGASMAQNAEQPAVVLSSSTFESGEFDWIEKNGIENLKGRIVTADTLAKEAATTLTVLLAGVGGSLAYAIKLLEASPVIGAINAAGASPASLSAAAVCFWLTILAIALVLKCMMFSRIPAVYNQPGQLLMRAESNESYENWRYGELINIEERIQRATERNRQMAVRLNTIRIFATLTPFVACIPTRWLAPAWTWVTTLV